MSEDQNVRGSALVQIVVLSDTHHLSIFEG